MAKTFLKTVVYDTDNNVVDAFALPFDTYAEAQRTLMFTIEALPGCGGTIAFQLMDQVEYYFQDQFYRTVIREVP